MEISGGGKSINSLYSNKKTYDLRSIWQGYVKVADILGTHPMNEMIAQLRDIGRIIGNVLTVFEEGPWMDEKHIRPKWYGPTDENHRTQEGKRDRGSDMEKGDMEEGNTAVFPTSTAEESSEDISRWGD